MRGIGAIMAFAFGFAACSSGGTRGTLDAPASEAPTEDVAGEAPDLPVEAAEEGLATLDAAGEVTGAADAAGDVEVMRGCPASEPGDPAIELFPDLADTQIHASAAFDGEGVWVAFNVPRGDGSGAFEVRAARLRCDGSYAVAPFSVATAVRGNDVDPDVAVGNGRVLVAWQSDTGGDPNLLTIWRVFEVDGTPVMAGDRVLDLTFGGEPVEASAWVPRVAASPDGGFALAGSWASTTALRFQVFVQRIADGGEPVGNPFEPFAETGVTEMYPAVAVAPGGDLYLAWTRSEDDGPDAVVHGRVPAGATSIEPSPPQPAGTGATSDSASLVALTGPGGEPDGRVLLAFQSGEVPDVVVRFAQAGATSASLVIGAAGKADQVPALAADEDGVAVAWYRVRSGIRNDLWVQRIAPDGTSPAAVGDPTLLNPGKTGNDHDAAPYPPAIAATRRGVFFVAWSEGKSPAFRLKGRFVKP